MDGWIGYGPKESETGNLYQYLKSFMLHSKASIKMPIST